MSKADVEAAVPEAPAVADPEKVKVVEVASLESYPGDDIAAKITAAVESSPVVVFGKVHCPFSIEARRIFASLGVKPLDFDVDVMPQGGEVWDTLKKLHAPQKTVPYVYVNKAMIGGCDMTKQKHSTGELQKMLSAAGVKIIVNSQTSSDARIARCGVLEKGSEAGGTLIHFPEALDNRAVRFNGFWGFVICLLCAIYYKEPGAHWTMGGLMVDFACRFMGGGNFSPLGSLSACCCALLDATGKSRPIWIAGPPKQFASLCGLMFSTLSFFFFMVSIHEDKLNIVGLSFACALGAASLMEWALDFCLGCWMFGMMIKFGLVKDTVYQTFINTKDETEYTYDFFNKRLNEGDPPMLAKRFNSEYPVKVDYKYKAKTDDMTKEDFHPIKHVKIMHFVMHLGIVGLACAWKAADPIGRMAPFGGLNAPSAVYYAIAVFSAIWYFTWVVLYIMKICLYPSKVFKEMNNNVAGPCFSLPFVILVLYAYIEYDRDPEFAKVLFWIGAPTSLAISLIWVSGWIASKKELEHVNAAWMLMPVGNFVAAAVGPVLDPAYRNAMQFWFAVAFMFYCCLLVITVYKAFVMPEYDDRVRPAMAAWVAAPAIGAFAYIACYGQQSIAAYKTPNAVADTAQVLAMLILENPLLTAANPSLKAAAQQLAAVPAPTFGYQDFIFINLYWFSIASAIILVLCFWRPYFGRIRFDMSYWAASFPACAMCICSILYNSLKPGDLAEAIAYTCLFLASYITVILLLQTLASLLRLGVFVPDYKWGPMSYMRLSHEALRGASPRLLDAAKNCGTDATALATLRSLWAGVLMMHTEHGRHEDEIIFRTYNEFFPNLTHDADHQHHELDALLDKISKMLAAGGETLSGAAAGELSEAVEKYVKELEAHLRWEEDHLQAMPRKYIPLGLAKQIIAKCWASTDARTWHVLLPLLVENMPMSFQRVRFIKTLLWSMPERCHQFGLILAKGVDAVTWRRIIAEVPEIIPRGVNMYWERYY
ncbi:hypothetical protein HYH03_004784 [Edaphochlamys debaryana]|uniref:Uncharacterized protein n=1 Tax=Edaphochlamys debaryana TaxID=47281 RepID=A0A835YE97_9CHLO|nr:hypothetical protein HYH03_004784 [Edaphochlamys debaryana]|eukprot:KAG2497195.1 hypothetical protein HYH03_004784 [Edaphochlamys debaryana]